MIAFNCQITKWCPIHQPDVLDASLMASLVPLDRVIETLKRFVADQTLVRSRRRERLDEQSRIRRERDASQDAAYFGQYLEVVPLDDKLALWRAVYRALYRYYVLLVDRFKKRSAERRALEDNDALLGKLGDVMTSEQANSLLVPPLATMMGAHRKRAPADGNRRPMAALPRSW